jgi:hypothetical protein
MFVLMQTLLNLAIITRFSYFLLSSFQRKSFSLGKYFGSFSFQKLLSVGHITVNNTIKMYYAHVLMLYIIVDLYFHIS